LDILAAVKKTLLITSLGIACFGVNAQATTYYQSNGTSVENFRSFLGSSVAATPGATVQTSSPFIVNGVSQGSYLSATNYPTANFTSTATASSQGIWVGLLMNPATANFWGGGFALSRATTDSISQASFIVNTGWSGQGNTTKIVLLDWNQNKSNDGYTVSVGQQIAVMINVYDSGNSGTFNTASLYIDSDLTNGVSFSSAIVNAFNITTAASQIKSIRLQADPGPTGYAETRYYDNVIASTSQQEVVQFLATGQASAVPEPSTYGFIGVGALGVAFAARRRKLKTA